MLLPNLSATASGGNLDLSEDVNHRERKKVWRNSQVTQTHRCNWKDCQGWCMMWGMCQPDTTFLLLMMMRKKKNCFICHCSKKLGIAFWLMSRDSSTPLQINKNLQVCKDCHTPTKFTSKIVGRAIIMSNANCFHHFEEWCLFFHRILVMAAVYLLIIITGSFCL